MDYLKFVSFVDGNEPSTVSIVYYFGVNFLVLHWIGSFVYEWMKGLKQIDSRAYEVV